MHNSTTGYINHIQSKILQCKASTPCHMYHSSTLPLILHHCWMIALSVAGAETALPLVLASAETALPLPLAGAETALSVAGAETALAQDS